MPTAEAVVMEHVDVTVDVVVDVDAVVDQLLKNPFLKRTLRKNIPMTLTLKKRMCHHHHHHHPILHK